MAEATHADDGFLPCTIEGYLRPRPHRTAFGDHVLAGLQIGAVTGCYGYLLTPAFDLVAFTPLGLLLSTIVGAVLGFVAGLFSAAVLFRRDQHAIKPFLCYGTVLLTMAAGVFAPSYTLLLGPAALWGLSLIALFIWPRRWHGERFCRSCGYDLRGSIGSGRCPECGGEGAERPWYLRTGGARRPLRAALAFALRRPVLSTMIGVIALAIAPTVRDSRHALRAFAFERAVNEASETGQSVRLDSVVGGDWNRIHVYSTYGGPTIKWSGEGRAAPSVGNGNEWIILFLNDSEPREYLIVQGYLDNAPAVIAREDGCSA